MKRFKIISASFFFLQYLLCVPLKNLNDSSVLLKSASDATCTYSIGLYDSNANGWEGNTADVVIDDIPVLSGITLDSGSGPAYFDFDVSASSTITVLYNNLGSGSKENSYNITSGALGSGSNVYNSLPLFLAFVITSCPRICTFSVNLFYSSLYPRGPNSLSIYRNGVSVVFNLSLSDLENSKVANFVVRRDDILKISFYFNYQGAQQNIFPYYFKIYRLPNASGATLYTFQNYPNGPPVHQGVPNFCSQSLSLALSSPDIISPTTPYTGSSLQLLVTPSFSPSNPLQVLTTLVCGENSVSQHQLSSSTVIFTIPDSFKGDCYFVANSTDPMAPPYAQSSQFDVYLTYGLTFTSPTAGSSYALGVPIPVLIETTAITTQSVDVLFSCPNSVSDTFTVTTGTSFSYTFSDSALGSCSFSVPNPPDLTTAPTPVTVNIVTSMRIASPQSVTSLTYGQAVSLQVNTNDASGAKYTASFSSTSGSFQVTGLIAGVSYKLVPSGIYGNVVLTVTATNLNPVTVSFKIIKPDSNIHPSTRNSKSSSYSSVYAHMKDGRELLIIGTNQFQDTPDMD